MIALFSLVYLLISSLSTHKEHRFITPIIPFLLLVSTYCLQTNQKLQLFSIIGSKKIIKLAIVLIAITNMTLFASFSAYGKSSGVAAWKYIGERISNM